MKIDHTIVPLPGTASLSPARQAPAGATAPGAKAITPAPSDPAAPAAEVLHLQAPVRQSEGGDFDAASVAEIREAIKAGRYRIDTTRIADGLLDAVRDLLGKTP